MPIRADVISLSEANVPCTISFLLFNLNKLFYYKNISKKLKFVVLKSR